MSFRFSLRGAALVALGVMALLVVGAPRQATAQIKDNSGVASYLTGSLGIGTATPNSLVQAYGGEVQVGSSSNSCSSTTAGAIRYNSTNLYYCNGTSWTSVGGGGTPGGANTQVQFNNSGAFGGSSNFVWDNTNGRVGIGTTTPSNDLSFGGAAAREIWLERNPTSATAGNGLTVEAGGAYSGGTNLNGGNLTLASGVSTGTGTSSIQFQTFPAGTTGTADNSATTAMTILGSGYVGIGTTSPTAVITIKGSGASNYQGIQVQNTFADATDKGALAILGARHTNANASFSGFGTWDNGSGRVVYIGGGGWGVPDSNDIIFITAAAYDETNNAGVERMRIISSGNVGIGTTGPGATLDVLGPNSSTDLSVRSSSGQIQFYAYSTPANYIESTNAAGTASELLVFTGNAGGTGTFSFSGNVGIGTTAPSASLQVGSRSSNVNGNNSTVGSFGASSAGGIAYPLTLANTATGAVANETQLTFTDASTWGATGAIGSVVTNAGNAASDLRFLTYTGSALSEFMRIQGSTGNVGIGTTSPTRILDVAAAVTHSTSGLASQIALRSPTAPTNKLNLGYDTTSDYGFIEAVNESTAWQNLALQPSGGKVGIGTTSPLFALEVSNPGWAVADTDGGVGYGEEFTFSNNGTLAWEMWSGAPGSYLEFYDDHAAIARMDINSGGDVVINGVDGQGMAIVDTNSNFWIGGSGGINYIYSENSSWTAAALLEFGDVTYPGIFDFNGSVGIGVTTPQASLNILGANLDSTADLMFTYDSTGEYQNGIANSFYGGAPAWNHMDFLVSGGATTGSVNVMTLTGAGEVGIGTTQPFSDSGYHPLTINGSAGGEIFLAKAGTIDGDIWADAGGIGLFSGVSMPIVFGPGGSEKFRITSAGSVGIGTTSPNAALDVNSTSIIIEQSHTPSHTATCTAGTMWWDTGYIYVCTASGTVKRAALSTF